MLHNSIKIRDAAVDVAVAVDIVLISRSIATNLIVHDSHKTVYP